MRIRLLLLSTTFLLFFIPLKAQEKAFSSFEFGLRGGVNVSGLAGTYQDSMNTQYKVGFHAGIFTKYSITEKLKIGMELLGTRKGFKSDVVDTFNRLLIFTQNYYQLEFPVMLEYQVFREGSVELGAAYAVNIYTEKVNFPQIRPYNEDYQDITGFIGFNYFLEEATTIGIRYSYGLNQIVETRSTNAVSSNFQILIKARLL